MTPRPQPSLITLSGAPSADLQAAVEPGPSIQSGPAFDDWLIDRIDSDGFVTVTVHVCLADHRFSKMPARLGDGDNPDTNLCWGARYGVDRYLADATDWRRVDRDSGDGQSIVRRSVFRRAAVRPPTWPDRGASRGFDVYVLLLAWRHQAILEAMKAPLRDGLGLESLHLTIGGKDIPFRSASVVTGYVGQNALLKSHENIFHDLEGARAYAPIGVFYVAPHSALGFHQWVRERGLYPVLFARESVTPEGYVVAGLLDALIEGDLDAGFVRSAAKAYARYQKAIDRQQAASLFYR